MSSDGLVLNATYLELTRITGALQVTTGRSTLDLFRPNGELLFVASVTALEQPCLCAAWRIGNRHAPALLAVGTTVGPHDDLPRLALWRRRREVAGRLRQLGPFWLAEAAGARLSVTIDDGRMLTTTRPRRRAGPMRFRITHSF